jgi:hypothetical protein
VYSQEIGQVRGPEDCAMSSLCSRRSSRGPSGCTRTAYQLASPRGGAVPHREIPCYSMYFLPSNERGRPPQAANKSRDIIASTPIHQNIRLHHLAWYIQCRHTVVPCPKHATSSLTSYPHPYLHLQRRSGGAEATNHSHAHARAHAHAHAHAHATIRRPWYPPHPPVDHSHSHSP